MHAQYYNAVWPTKTDYDRAFAQWQDTILDRELRYGMLKEDKTGILQQARLDNHACLYRIDDWMVRCFCRTEDSEPPENIARRYELLCAFSSRNQSRVSALLPLRYIPKGIKVEYFEEGTWTMLKENVLPIVIMPYVQALSLGTFVTAYYKDSRLMTRLYKEWVSMIDELEAAQMAHGDLDLTNVLVQYSEAASQLQLKLIDYDNSWIPEFSNYTLPEHGHQHFQHPAFFGKDHAYNAEMDRFAALVIYISLKALSEEPSLYDEFEVNDEVSLLFTAHDYEMEHRGSTGHIRQLQARHIPGLEAYLDELCQSLHASRMPRSMSSIARDEKAPRLVSEEVPNNLGGPSTLLEQGYEEVVWSDWDNIEYFQRGSSQPTRSWTPASASPVPGSQQKRPEEVWELPTRYTPPVPESRPQSPQQQIVIGSSGSTSYSQMHNDSTISANQYAGYDDSQVIPPTVRGKSMGTSGRSTIVGCAVVSAILLLILLILLITVLNFTHH